MWISPSMVGSQFARGMPLGKALEIKGFAVVVIVLTTPPSLCDG
jgi:hypothetical protein